MKIFRYLPVWAIAALMLTSCGGGGGGNGLDGEDSPVVPPTPIEEVDPPINEPLVAPNARIDDGRHVTAYVTYYGSLTPDPTVLTHINYAFAELYMVDGVYQKFDLEGSKTRFQNVVNLKKNYPDLKICLSFTHGVANSNNKQGGSFSALCKSDENMQKFADDCVAFMEEWGIDGIDLDWEFPGLSWSGAACDVSCDTDNYVKLVKKLRETFGDARYVELPEPSMGAEDFAYYLQRCPGVYVKLGVGEEAPPLHNSKFDFPDEAIEPGIRYFVGFALAALR